MTVSEFAEKAGCVVFSEGEEREIGSGYCGDFLSNIISRATDDCAWLTVMNNAHRLRVHYFVRGRCARRGVCRARKTARAVGARRRGERVRGGKEGGCDLRGVSKGFTNFLLS